MIDGEVSRLLFKMGCQVKPEILERWGPEQFLVFKERSELGDPEATLMLGKCYELGNGCPQSFEQAFAHYLKSAQGGSVLGMVSVADCFTSGAGVACNVSAAIDWLERAIKIEDSVDLRLNLARLYASLTNAKTARVGMFKHLRAATSAGSLVAQVWLAKNLWNSPLTNQESDEGCELMLKAAEAGSVVAQFEMGEGFQFANAPLKHDMEEAINWYTRAAQQDCAKSCFTLCMLYWNKTTIPMNIEKGLNWLLRAANLNFPEAQYYLAMTLLNAKTDPPEHGVSQAISWLERAAANELPEAIELLASLSTSHGGSRDQSVIEGSLP